MLKGGGEGVAELCDMDWGWLVEDYVLTIGV